MRPSLQPMELRFADVSAVKPDECQCQDDLVTVDKGLEIGKIGKQPRGISWCFWVRKKIWVSWWLQCLSVILYIYICIYKYIFMGQHPHAYTHIYICFFVWGETWWWRRVALGWNTRTSTLCPTNNPTKIPSIVPTNTPAKIPSTLPAIETFSQ